MWTNLSVGVTGINPDSYPPGNPREVFSTELPHYWINHVRLPYSKQGNLVNFTVSASGEMRHSINGVAQSGTICGVETDFPLWVAMEFRGTPKSIEFETAPDTPIVAPMPPQVETTPTNFPAPPPPASIPRPPIPMPWLARMMAGPKRQDILSTIFSPNLHSSEPFHHTPPPGNDRYLTPTTRGNGIGRVLNPNADIFVPRAVRRTMSTETQTDPSPIKSTSDRQTQTSSTWSPDDCEICMATVADAVLIPCGHATFCEQCATKWKQDTASSKGLCPICRRKITRVQKMFR